MDLALESLSESDCAKSLHAILINYARVHRKTFEEISDVFVKLSGDLSALALFLKNENIR